MSEADVRHTVGAHLAGLVRRADELARLLPERETGDERVEARRREATLASLRLDGSPVATWPDPARLAALDPDAAVRGDAGGEGTRGSWFDTMRTFDDPPDEDLQLRELRGVLAALAADDLVEDLARAPATALRELHRRLTVGLVAGDRAGRLRRTEQAVHDASVGRIVYFTADPEALPAAFDALVGWLAGPATELPVVVASGILHLRLLQLHPFEAANGRLARAAARLWLRRGARDPLGLAVPELALARDPLGYHEEVARSSRRRDASVWLERWAEAVVDGLRGSARDLGLLRPEVDATALAPLGTNFTVADVRDLPTVADLPAAVEQLERWLDAGLVERVPGSRGLRFLVPGPAVAGNG
ncbi:Fic family protein [Egicoccus halophilus]|uniref:Fido domain-containing protein n=1 Tax=Egicoccus halophilus TaxID=1670830 RepID=A0A8J3ACM9_9ACTN|nr:Fic family protein [Egicoccus halophilus]GGI08751.1 hypothetical protein GCM10011354_30650 [Egicoccus halophilus]